MEKDYLCIFLNQESQIDRRQLMKYFTRELYNEMANPQSDERKWNSVLQKYSNHIKCLRPRLTDEWKELLNLDIHDSKVAWIERDDNCSLVLNLDLTNGVGPADGLCKLVFENINGFETVGEPEDDVCLYAEIDESEKGGCVFSILLRRSELCIHAENVKLLMLSV